MIVSAHAGNKNNVFAVRQVGAGEILEIPYRRVHGVEDGMIVDINDSLGWWRRRFRFGLTTVVLGVVEPVVKASGRDAGIGDHDVNGLVRGICKSELERVRDVVPGRYITLDKLGTVIWVRIIFIFYLRFTLARLWTCLNSFYTY